MLEPILMLFVFAFFIVLMITQKLSTFFALIGMALGLAIIGGAPWMGNNSIIKTVLHGGASRLGSSMIACVFGAWLGQIMNETGITRDIIRRATELAGDKKVTLCILITLANALVHTAITGLGSVIMVGQLILPILAAAGIAPLAAGCIFLLGRTIGLMLNLYQWQIYIDVAKLTTDQIRPFAIVTSAILFVVVLAFILIEVQLKRKRRVAWAAETTSQSVKKVLGPEKKVPLIALVTPLIPFVFVMAFKWDIVPAIFAGVLYAVLVTTRFREMFRVLNKTIFEATKEMAFVFVLMIAIGILLAAVGLPQVSGTLVPLFESIMPTTAMPYLVFFTLVAPLALYRGPMGVWGMGSGVMALMIATGKLPLMAIYGGFMASHVVQLSGDPTATQLIWTADYLDIDLNKLTVKLFSYLWPCVFVTMIFATLFYMW